MRLYAYNTRYEIHDYELGTIPKLEHDMSIYDKNLYLPDTFHYDPKYYYDENEKILYIPRGYNIKKIEALVGKSAVIKKESNPADKISYSIINPPKSDNQKMGVRFLAGLDDYKHMRNEAQQVLALPTGEGKTYCAIAACSLLEMKSLVIVGTDDLRKQWNTQILKHTNLRQSNVRMITGSSIIEKLRKMSIRKRANHAFYITTHSTLRSYIKNFGLKALNDTLIELGIGIKIIDEAHLQYENTFIIDYAVNVSKNFYLTATFAQSNDNADVMFQKAYYDLYKLRIEPSSRKHVVWIRCKFSSHANAIENAYIRNSRGFDKFKYIEYEMGKPHMINAFKEVMKLLIGRMKIEGKILVLSSKKESCDFFRDILKDLYPEYSSCVHYTGSKVDTFEPYGAIFATASMLGTGSDIAGLRAIINLECISSKRNTIQIVGRLREYAPDKDTYYVEFIDMSLYSLIRMTGKRESVLQDIVKDTLNVEIGG